MYDLQGRTVDTFDVGGNREQNKIIHVASSRDRTGASVACSATREAATRAAVDEITAPVATADPEPTTPVPAGRGGQSHDGRWAVSQQFF